MMWLYYAGNADLDTTLILGALCDKYPLQGVLPNLGMDPHSMNARITPTGALYCAVFYKVFMHFFPGLLSLLLAVLPMAQAATPSPHGACPALLQHNFLRLQDEKPLSLCQYAGKVVVVVNTASFCGFTSQYEGLEALHSRYKDQGLVVLGFPSNDFSQESGSNKQIAEFCENTFGVKFPMFTKTPVIGKDASPLFKQLSARTGTAPKWNFYKYVISRNGQNVESFNSMADPKSNSFIKEIEKQLAIRQMP